MQIKKAESNDERNVTNINNDKSLTSLNSALLYYAQINTEDVIEEIESKVMNYHRAEQILPGWW